MAKFIDYYKILGVPSNADDETIKKAYKKLALKWHPDRHQDDKEEAEKMFKEIGEAYACLSDPQKRARYDAGGDDMDFDSGMGGMGGMGGIDLSELFASVFGGGGLGGMGGMNGFPGFRFSTNGGGASFHFGGMPPGF